MPAHARATRGGAAVIAVATRAGAAVIALAALAAGCGLPPDLRDPPGSVVPSPQTGPPTASPPPAAADLLPTAAPSATPTFGEATAVPCQGRPSAAQVLALLRTSGVLPRGETATLSSGTPLCAGTWQYSEIVVSKRDPLLVVTRGAPGALALVTAGTNVCNIPVRTSAPTGIRVVACERGQAPGNV